jgi:hypothetical protein
LAFTADGNGSDNKSQLASFAAAKGCAVVYVKRNRRANMLRQLILSALPIWVFAVGCGASVNQAYKADIDRRVAALHPGTESYPSSAATEPMPLAVGQWIEVKMLDDKHNPSFMTYKIVGQQGDAFWIETLSQSYTSKSETRMLVNLGNRKDLDAIEVKAFTMRHDGKLTEYPPDMLGLLKSMWKPFVSALVISWADLPREDAQVPAGSFAGCFKQRSTASFAGYEMTSDAWLHPAVPINGLVRSVGVDKPVSMELVAFGTSGASSAF